ncbi:LOW QUALITY PROTEIN: hypothetical protein PanWU01x14_159770 [Parasponia andersonii]|uniref:Uncharacterized protein n=1 Tax=Parasponia andersonii TaxID=3476 RepID=A0A2P5CEM0_PARAD|nr:LOW QUALITY PROTEIN: hypothetical protein PanWU01x14_159770 [Parasponia andersonii]
MAAQENTFLLGMFSNTSTATSKQPHLAYISTSAVPMNTSESNAFIFFTYSINFPSQRAPKCVQAVSAVAAQYSSGTNLIANISWKTLKASEAKPHRIYPSIRTFHRK